MALLLFLQAIPSETYIVLGIIIGAFFVILAFASVHKKKGPKDYWPIEAKKSVGQVVHHCELPAIETHPDKPWLDIGISEKKYKDAYPDFGEGVDNV